MFSEEGKDILMFLLSKMLLLNSREEQTFNVAALSNLID
jgi:hypothetical protein